MNVVLRPWREDDADWYAAAVRDPDIQRFTTEGDVSADRVRVAIRRLAGHAGAFCVAAADDGRPVGNAGWKELDEPGEVEAYYWVAAEARGAGVASAVLAELWSRAGAARMVVVIHAENAASLRVAERSGFSRTGRDGERVVLERTS